MRVDAPPKRILPIGLLLEGKPCLVVGGGSVAARKVGHLLDAAARVTVVSPELCPELARRKKAGRIAHRDRPFAAADVNGQTVVFAATDDGDVNRRVLQACRRRRILCGAADAQWSAGDFITPAIVRRRGVTVAVSTGGASCRRARDIKERLAACLAGEQS